MSLLDLIRDTSDNTLSWSKCGTVLACLVFTYKMVRDLPDDFLLWTIYMATVGGFVILLKFLNLKFGGGKGAP